MTLKTRKDDFNPDWEKEIASYDAECKTSENEFIKHHMLIGSEGNAELASEEKEVLSLYLKGTSIETIAEQNQVDVDIVYGLMEIIKAKLSLDDKWKET